MYFNKIVLNQDWCVIFPFSCACVVLLCISTLSFATNLRSRDRSLSNCNGVTGLFPLHNVLSAGTLLLPYGSQEAAALVDDHVNEQQRCISAGEERETISMVK